MSLGPHTSINVYVLMYYRLILGDSVTEKFLGENPFSQFYSRSYDLETSFFGRILVMIQCRR